MESEQNKSEQATPYKLKKAREKGQVAKSMEFNAILALAVFLLLGFALFGQMSSDFFSIGIKTFRVAGNAASNGIHLEHILVDFLIAGLTTIVPLLAGLVLIAVLSNILQIGVVFSLFPLKPNFSKMNPVNNLKKIFSKRTLFELVKVLMKITCFTLVLVLMSDFIIGQLQSMVNIPAGQLAGAWQSLFFQLALTLLFVLTGIALIDFLFNRQDFKKKMMMSKREVKEEYKNREGDPEIKAKRKQNQKELFEKTASLSNVKDSDVVITNPTHIAVALQFDRHTMLSPKVVAIGRGELAEHIRQQARRHRVPIVRNVPLARLLYKKLSLAQFIPNDLFKEVAPVYKWLYEIQGVSTGE